MFANKKAKLANPERQPLADDLSPLGDLRFVRLLPPDAWAALPAAIQRRFNKRVKAGQSVLYRGQTLTTRMNRTGFLFAQLLRPVGAPLPLERCQGGAAAVVTVTECPDGAGQFWVRQYNRKTGFPQVIQSAKAFAGPTGLEEGIGYGIGMTLSLQTGPTSLLFRSERYFLTLFGKRLYLPHWLTPGTLTVGHHDLGDGRFDFTLDLIHPRLGEMVHQRARFEDMEGAI